jgi:2,4-dienoyl-CoA reductase-like NADH-dependent reductase (Old Yellow Enzyme family)
MNQLFQPLSFPSGAVVRNRIALAPLTNLQSADDGVISPDEHAWLERRAAGGFGLVSTCAAHVCAEGKGFDGQLGCFHDRHDAGLAALASALAQRGALGVVQLYHGGVRSPSRLTGVQPISASSFTEAREGFEVPRAASTSEIEKVIEDFVSAAKRAQRAGFGGVELHAAHGYLLSQFLSSELNPRTDGWGGSLEHRARLVRTIAQRVRAECPPPFVMGVRLSPEDYGFARGIDLDETAEVAAWLADDGADFVHLSLWDGKRLSKKRPDEHPLTAVRRSLGSRVPLLAAGGVWSRADAEALLDRGADAVALGKAAILHPDWPLEAERDPSYSPRRGPMTPAELAERAVGPRFMGYLRRFQGLVAEG